MHGRFPFRQVHVLALSLCAIMLPWSTAFLSIAQMLLAANWLAEGIVQRDLGGRFKRAFTSAPVLVFLGFLGLHLLGLLWTSDSAWGFDRVRILAPVLVFGVILGGSPRLQPGELRTILLWGVASVLANTFACVVMAEPDADFRSLSRFISHIRLALMLVLAVVVLWYYLKNGLAQRLVMLLLVAWIWYFLGRLGSVQGATLILLLLWLYAWSALRNGTVLVRRSLRMVLLIMPLAAITWAWMLWTRISDTSLAAPPTTTEYTAGGEEYVHVAGDMQLENGTPVWQYVAWGELRRSWALRSKLDIDSLDARGHVVKGTLARYLSSLGLRKDSVGVMALSDADVQRVEQGVTSAHAERTNRFVARLQEVLFELQRYRTTGDANGHSITQRLEYWRTGMAIVRDHPLLGVGTGDTQRAFDAKYEELQTSLLPQWRHRAHNQYLTLWISLGVFGLLFALFSWWWPAWKLSAWRDPLFVAWAIIFGISCLTDDTVETQTGATFFAFHYALLVFAAPRVGISGRAPTTPAPGGG